MRRRNLNEFFAKMDILLSAILFIVALGFFVAWYRGIRSREALREARDTAALEAERLRTENGFLQQKYEEQLRVQQSRRQELETRWKEQQEAMEARFRCLAADILTSNTSHLKESNREQMDAILQPLREQLEGLGRAVHESKETSVSNRASLEEALKNMMDKAERIGHDAVNLAQALKGNTKAQGDWGEVVLERMLEASGLRKDEEYYLQEDFTTEEGKHVRPDVVVRFPGRRCVVIDSKVSLTAYAQYMAAEEEEERGAYLAAHVASVRRHIQELAAKDYARVVKESISYVMMFMPNEASYVAALQAAPQLPQEAYRSKILLISPTNLLMALQLAVNLWQRDRQDRNVEAIMEKAARLYDKFATFRENFERVGRELEKARSSYDTAFSQLCDGRGNFVRQVEDLRQMGVSPRKRLPLVEEAEEGTYSS